MRKIAAVFATLAALLLATVALGLPPPMAAGPEAAPGWETFGYLEGEEAVSGGQKNGFHENQQRELTGY